MAHRYMSPMKIKHSGFVVCSLILTSLVALSRPWPGASNCAARNASV